MLTSAKNITRHIQKVFSLFWKFWSYDGGNFTPTLHQLLRGQNISIGKVLIEFTVPFDTLNYQPFFKPCILKTPLPVSLLFIFVWNKTFCRKNSWILFIYLFFWLGVAFSVTVAVFLCFWCSFYKVMENLGFIRYSRYNLLGIAITAVF